MAKIEKKATEEKNTTYIIEKVASGIKVSSGRLGRAQTYRVTVDENGESRSELIGDFTGTKFPNSNEDLTPLYDTIKGKWDFSGDDATLQALVKEIKLRYPDRHYDKGKVIESASLTDPNDPFFGNPSWRDDIDFVLKGGQAILNSINPRHRFLLLCQKGNRHTSSDDTLYESAGTKYKITQSNHDSKKFINDSNKEMELAVQVSNLTIDQAKLISIILGLIFSGEAIEVESLKPNLLTSIKRDDKNPNGDIRLFSGRSYMSFFRDLVQDDLATLTKKSNIKLGMNQNILRYKDGSYTLKGKILGKTESFSDLVSYFTSAEADDDYLTLQNSLLA